MASNRDSDDADWLGPEARKLVDEALSEAERPARQVLAATRGVDGFAEDGVRPTLRSSQSKRISDYLRQKYARGRPLSRR
jgi:hypothetical protein